MSDDSAGEAACYLDRVDDTGRIPDDCCRIRLQGEGRDGRPLVINGSGSLRDLVPREGEDPVKYRARLEEPAARTAAWHIVLAADKTPVTIALQGRPAADEFARALVDFLRDLMG